MIGTLFLLMAFLALGMMVVMFVAIGWWALPIALIVAVVGSTCKAIAKIKAGKQQNVPSSSNVVILSKEDVERILKRWSK